MQFFARTRLLITATFITGFVLVAAAFLLGMGPLENATGVTSNVALAQSIENSSDECVVCHTNHTPGIVNQYAESDHFASNVSCADCHLVEEGFLGNSSDFRSRR